MCDETMPWSVTVHPELPVVQTNYSGLLTRAELKEAILGTLAATRERGIHRVLSDCRGLAGGHSALDLYEFAKLLTSIEGFSRLREAVLVPALPARAEDVAFWQALCANRAITVKLFCEPERALEWLMNEE